MVRDATPQKLCSIPSPGQHPCLKLKELSAFSGPTYFTFYKIQRAFISVNLFGSQKKDFSPICPSIRTPFRILLQIEAALR
jgi:hypothetical protein